MSKPSILFITAYYPPLPDIAGFRISEFARYLPEFGWEPYVLTVSPDEAIHQQDNITRIPLQSYYRLSQASAPAPDDAIPGVYQRAVAYATDVVKKLFAPLFIPDTLRIWSTTRLRSAAARMIREHHIDTVLVSCAPFSLPLAVLPLRKHSRIRVFLDFRDGLTLNPYSIYPDHMEQRMHRYEEHILKQCDGFITTTPLTTAAYIEKYPFLKHHTETVPNGFDETVFTNIDTKIKEDVFTVTYAGVVDEHRCIDPIIRAFGSLQLPHSQFLIMGKIRSTTTERLIHTTPQVRFLGQQPRSRSIQQMARSHLLVLNQGFSMKTAKCYPVAAKTYEYLRLGNPILCYAPPGDNCAIIKKYCARPYIVQEQSQSALQHALQNCYDAWVNNRLMYTPHPEFLSLYNRRYLTGKLAEFLSRR